MKRRKESTPFARNLSALMKKRNLTHRTIADMAGVSTSTVAGWLNSASPNDYTKVANLARALETSFEWLLTGNRGRGSVEDIPIEDLFEDDTFELKGIWRINAVRLRRKSDLPEKA